MEPFPNTPIRVRCPGCGNVVLFPPLLGYPPGTTISCECQHCGHKVVAPLGGSSRSNMLQIAFALVVLVAAVAAVFLLAK